MTFCIQCGSKPGHNIEFNYTDLLFDQWFNFYWKLSFISINLDIVPVYKSQNGDTEFINRCKSVGYRLLYHLKCLKMSKSKTDAVEALKSKFLQSTILWLLDDFTSSENELKDQNYLKTERFVFICESSVIRESAVFETRSICSYLHTDISTC